jgi:hypothetical protein
MKDDWLEGIEPVAWPPRSPDFIALDIFCRVVWGREYRGSKSEGRRQLVETVNEAAVGVGNELGRW